MGVIRPCSQERENPRVCSLFLHAALCFLREACRTLPAPLLLPLSITRRLLCSRVSLAFPLGLGECSSQSGSRAALINLPKCAQTLRGTSSPLLFSLCNDLNSSSARSDQWGIMQCRAARNNLVCIQGCIFTERLRSVPAFSFSLAALLLQHRITKSPSPPLDWDWFCTGILWKDKVFLSCYCCTTITYQDVWLLSSSSSKLARISSQWWAHVFYTFLYSASAFLCSARCDSASQANPAAAGVWLSLMLHESDKEK